MRAASRVPAPQKSLVPAWLEAGMPCLIKEVLYAPPCPERVSLLWEVALTHHNTSQYDMSVKTYLDGQLKWEDILAKELEAKGKKMRDEEAPPLPLIGQIFMRLAVAAVFDSAAADEKALAELMQAQRLCNALPATHPIQATIDSMLGVVYFHLSQYDLAADHFLRSLEARETTLGPDHLDTSLSLNNIGCCLHCLGKTADALVIYYKSEEILRKACRVEHPRLVTVMGNLAKAKQSYLKDSVFIPPEPKPMVVRLCQGRINTLRAQAKPGRKKGKRKK
ncbi:Kinesin light chain [Diplonema papillatum]|nr:Kinesin light chain [Diplonema papillatum]